MAGLSTTHYDIATIAITSGASGDVATATSGGTVGGRATRPPVVAQSDHAVESGAAKTEAAIKQKPLGQPTRHLMG